jgi:hypothetical protein
LLNADSFRITVFSGKRFENKRIKILCNNFITSRCNLISYLKSMKDFQGPKRKKAHRGSMKSRFQIGNFFFRGGGGGAIIVLPDPHLECVAKLQYLPPLHKKR